LEEVAADWEGLAPNRLGWVVPEFGGGVADGVVEPEAKRSLLAAGVVCVFAPNRLELVGAGLFASVFSAGFPKEKAPGVEGLAATPPNMFELGAVVPAPPPPNREFVGADEVAVDDGVEEASDLAPKALGPPKVKDIAAKM
jgi:hypothetical protein